MAYNDYHGTTYATGAAPIPAGYRRDANGTLVPIASPSSAAMAPVPDASSASLQMANKQMGRELAVNAGIAGALGAAQLGMSFFDTAQDTRNTERLKELEALEDQNKLGLTGAERAQYAREMLNPARAMARESRLNTEAAVASAGSGTSAANVTRAAREERRDVQNAAVQAGTVIGRASLDKADAQLREIEERTAYKSNRAADRLGLGMRTVSQVAPMVGQAAAAQVQVKEPTPDEIRKMFPQLVGMPDDQILAFYRSNQARGQQEAFDRMLSGSVTANPNLPLTYGYP